MVYPILIHIGGVITLFSSLISPGSIVDYYHLHVLSLTCTTFHIFHCTHVFHNTAEENDFRFVATEARNYTLTFTNITTSSQLCVTISLNEDQIAENVESFVVVLTAIDTDDTIGINSTTITINDNDGNLKSLCLRRLALHFHGDGYVYYFET